MSMLESVAESTEVVIVLPQEVQGCWLSVWRRDSGSAALSLLPKGREAQCQQSGDEGSSSRILGDDEDGIAAMLEDFGL